MLDLNRRSLLCGVATAATFSSVTSAFAAADAAVMLHGKGDSPNGSLSPVAGALQSAGIRTTSPEMPWSSSRYLSSNWPTAMAQIAQEIANLKAAGANRIILVGHSMGCPAAMSYASRYAGVAGIVLCAPGHSPAGFYRMGFTREAVDRARALVKAGRGAETQPFTDNNQGRPLNVNLPAADYLSFLDPAGQAEMSNTAGRVRVPAMWIAGTGDQVSSWGAGIGQRVARGPKGKYLIVNGDHRSTPSAAAAEVVAWAKAL